MSHLNRSLAARRAVVVGLTGILLATSMPAGAFADTETDLASARAQLEQIGRESDRIIGQLSELTCELEETRAQIDEKNIEIADRQDKLSTFVSSEYKGGLAGLIDIMMNAESFDDLVSKVTYMNKVSNAQAQTIEEVKVLKKELADKQSQQEDNVEATQKQVDALNAQRASAASLVNSLDAKLQEELAAEAAANAALQQALQQSQQEQIEDVQNVPVAPPASEQGDEGGQPGPSPTPTPNPQPQPAPDPEPEPTPEPNYVPSTGNAVVDRARSWIGKAEYVWGGCAPGKFDCSGFVSYCLTGSYTRLGTTHTFMNWPRVSDPQPGDIAVNSYHTGIYVGGGQMIHAATYGVGVVQGPVMSDMIFVRY